MMDGRIHQKYIESEHSGSLCGRAESDTDGYYYVPQSVDCPECLRKLRDGYLAVLGKLIADDFAFSPTQLILMEDGIPSDLGDVSDLSESPVPIAPPESLVTGDQLLPGEAADLPPIDLLIDGEKVDPNSLFQPEPTARPLTVEALNRIGAMTPEDRPATNEITRHLQQQNANYQHYSKDQLIEELVRRDQNEIRRGQEAAEGKTAGRLLREFVRGILYTADKADLNQIEGELNHKRLNNGQQIETILELLGAEKADRRQLRLEGSMLGKMDSRPAEEAIQDPLVRQMPSAETADQIRNNPNRPKNPWE